jgi:hypothetical protein
MAGITTARGEQYSVHGYLLLWAKPGRDHVSCGEVRVFCSQPAPCQRPRLPVHGPVSALKYLMRNTFHSSGRLGRTCQLSVLEMSICTNSCRKKVLGKWPNCRCTLAAITWPSCGPDPPATFVPACSEANRRMCSLQQERRYSGDAEVSVC